MVSLSLLLLWKTFSPTARPPHPGTLPPPPRARAETWCDYVSALPLRSAYLSLAQSEFTTQLHCQCMGVFITPGHFSYVLGEDI